jgi:hypothetical protein
LSEVFLLVGSELAGGFDVHGRCRSNDVGAATVGELDGEVAHAAGHNSVDTAARISGATI